MKKLLSIAVCASAVAAFATDTEINLGDVGVTAINSDLTNTIVAVSYKQLGDVDGNITISNIVKTANLTAGDLLHVFKNASNYETYALTSGAGGVLYWNKTLNYTINQYGDPVPDNSSSAASIATLGPGAGFWLVRPNGWEGASFNFYIYGKPVTAAVETQLTAGTPALIGNPTQTAKAPTITTAAVGDIIQIPDSANAALRVTKYKYTADGWKTKKNKVTTTTPDPPTIQPGMGFWYIPVSGNAPKITW